MSLSPQAIAEFKQIYREDYGITLTDAETLELATSFFNLMRVICRPRPGRDCERVEEMV
jgi:hypothetical protein